MITIEQKTKVIELYKQGIPKVQIAKKLKISRSMVLKIIKEYEEGTKMPQTTKEKENRGLGLYVETERALETIRNNLSEVLNVILKLLQNPSLRRWVLNTLNKNELFTLQQVDECENLAVDNFKDKHFLNQFEEQELKDVVSAFCGLWNELKGKVTRKDLIKELAENLELKIKIKDQIKSITKMKEDLANEYWELKSKNDILKTKLQNFQINLDILEGKARTVLQKRFFQN